MVDRVIAMTEPDIAENYDKQLVTQQAAAKYVEDTGLEASHDEMMQLGQALVRMQKEHWHKHERAVHSLCSYE